MKRRIKFELNAEQLTELEQAINGSVYPEVRQRAIAIRLLHLGNHPEQVAEAVMVSANTVWTWHRRYRKSGIAGLQDQARSGRPRKADSAYIARLEQLLGTDPRTLELPFTIWTVQRMRLYLAEQTGIRLSEARFRALLGRLGYVWKQPKHNLVHLQDADAQQTAAQILDWLKKTSLSMPGEKPNFSLWMKQP